MYHRDPTAAVYHQPDGAGAILWMVLAFAFFGGFCAAVVLLKWILPAFVGH